MNAIQRKAVLQEFENWLKARHYHFEKEIMLKKFVKTDRIFRFDYIIWPTYKGINLESKHATDLIAIEINGGQWVNGRHNRGGKGYEDDLTKLNLCAANHIPVFQFTYEMLLRKEYEMYIK